MLHKAYAPSLLVVSFHGYDVAGHAFYRYAHPEAFGDVAAGGRAPLRPRAGPLRLAGGAMGGARSSGTSARGTCCVVVSGHGLAPTPLWRRLVGTLTGTRVGAASHGGAPDGVLLVVGPGIRPGAVPANASVLDVAPTILYLMGLPVARDMEGRVLTEILEPAFARDNPVTFIPSYESLAVAPAAPGAPLDDLPPLPEDPR